MTLVVVEHCDGCGVSVFKFENLSEIRLVEPEENWEKTIEGIKPYADMKYIQAFTPESDFSIIDFPIIRPDADFGTKWDIYFYEKDNLIDSWQYEYKSIKELVLKHKPEIKKVKTI